MAFLPFPQPMSTIRPPATPLTRRNVYRNSAALLGSADGGFLMRSSWLLAQGASGDSVMMGMRSQGINSFRCVNICMQIEQRERCGGKPAGKADWAKFLIASTMIVGIGVGAALCNERLQRDCAGHE